MEKDLTKACSGRKRDNGLKLKDIRFRLHIRKQIFYSEGGETVKQIAHGSYGSPFTGQVGWALEKDGLVKNH